jgi:uroporphyrinogen decarboxylase
MFVTRRERLKALLAGRPVDRVPSALWRHFPEADFQPDAFVEASLQFHRNHDLDLVKINPRSSFGIRDYGAQDEFDGDFLGRCRYLNEVIQSPADWRRLRPLDPRAGWLGQTGECIRRIVAGVDPDTPVIATVFSPATQAKNLAGFDRLAKHWRDHPADVRAGLATLAESSVRFLESLRDVAIDGIFYPIQECGLPDLSPDYHTMCADLDRAILRAGPYWLNMLHLHGPIVGFDAYAAYPVSVLHWDECASGISLEEGRRRFAGLVCGGIAWPDEGWGDIASVRNARRLAIERIGAERLVLGAGCVIPYRTPAAYVDAFCSPDV